MIYKRGLVARKTEEMKLSSIETVEIEQTFWGRIFGYGDVKVTGRGLSDVLMHNISRPLAAKKQIESIRYA